MFGRLFCAPYDEMRAETNERFVRLSFDLVIWLIVEVRGVEESGYAGLSSGIVA